jgi:hypothetical protein
MMSIGWTFNPTMFPSIAPGVSLTMITQGSHRVLDTLSSILHSEFSEWLSRWSSFDSQNDCLGCNGVWVITVLIEDRSLGLCVVETMQYWSHTPVSLILRLFHYEKGQPRTGSGEMERVSCTHPTETSGMTYGGGVYALGWRKPILVLKDLSEGWYI